MATPTIKKKKKLTSTRKSKPNKLIAPKPKPPAKIIREIRKKMNPNRVREETFIISNTSKRIYYIKAHFKGIFYRKIHCLEICTDTKKEVEYENNGGLAKTRGKTQKEIDDLIKKTDAIAYRFFTAHHTIENDELVWLLKEKIKRNKLKKPTKATKTRLKQLEKGLQFVKTKIANRKVAKQEKRAEKQEKNSRELVEVV